jgi:hypothetical protein
VKSVKEVIVIQTAGGPEVGDLSIGAVSMTTVYTMLPGLWLFPHL